jgi:outer membrane immunogenic protein
MPLSCRQALPLLAVLAMAWSSTAQAADAAAARARLALAKSPVPQQRDWSGPYVGVHGAFVGTGLRSKSTPANVPALNLNTPTPLNTLPSARNRNTKSINGFGGGLQAGYNVQSGNIVYGVEAEGTVTSSDGGRTSATSLKAEQGPRGALKGRLGYSFGSTLVYGTLGAAVTQTRYSSPAVAATPGNPATAARKKSITSVGPVVGVGVEHMLTEQLSVKGEIDYAAFGSQKLTLPAGRTIVDGGQISAKVGLNYRF